MGHARLVSLACLSMVLSSAKTSSGDFEVTSSMLYTFRSFGFDTDGTASSDFEFTTPGNYMVVLCDADDHQTLYNAIYYKQTDGVMSACRGEAAFLNCLSNSTVGSRLSMYGAVQHAGYHYLSFVNCKPASSRGADGSGRGSIRYFFTLMNGADHLSTGERGIIPMFATLSLVWLALFASWFALPRAHPWFQLQVWDRCPGAQTSILFCVCKALRCFALEAAWRLCSKEGACELSMTSHRSLYLLATFTEMFNNVGLYLFLVCLCKGVGFSRPHLFPNERQRVLSAVAAYCCAFLLWRLVTWLFLFLVAITTCVLLFNVITAASKTIIWLRAGSVRISGAIGQYVNLFTVFRNGLVGIFGVTVLVTLFGSVVSRKELVSVARDEIRDCLLLLYTVAACRLLGLGDMVSAVQSDLERDAAADAAFGDGADGRGGGGGASDRGMRAIALVWLTTDNGSMTDASGDTTSVAAEKGYAGFLRTLVIAVRDGYAASGTPLPDSASPFWNPGHLRTEPSPFPYAHVRGGGGGGGGGNVNSDVEAGPFDSGGGGTGRNIPSGGGWVSASYEAGWQARAERQDAWAAMFGLPTQAELMASAQEEAVHSAAESERAHAAAEGSAAGGGGGRGPSGGGGGAHGVQPVDAHALNQATEDTEEDNDIEAAAGAAAGGDAAGGAAMVGTVVCEGVHDREGTVVPRRLHPYYGGPIPPLLLVVNPRESFFIPTQAGCTTAAGRGQQQQQQQQQLMDCESKQGKSVISKEDWSLGATALQVVDIAEPAHGGRTGSGSVQGGQGDTGCADIQGEEIDLTEPRLEDQVTQPSPPISPSSPFPSAPMPPPRLD